MEITERNYTLAENAQASGLEPETILDWRRRQLVHGESYLGNGSFLVPNLVQTARPENEQYTLVEVLRYAALRGLVEDHFITVLHAAEIVMWTRAADWVSTAKRIASEGQARLFIIVEQLGQHMIQVHLMPTIEGAAYFLRDSSKQTSVLDVTDPVVLAVRALQFIV